MEYRCRVKEIEIRVEHQSRSNGAEYLGVGQQILLKFTPMSWSKILSGGSGPKGSVQDSMIPATYPRF
jgi:hypothetical protein